LRVDADLPAGWDRFRLERRFRGAIYDIEVRRAADGEAPGCTVAGDHHEGDTLPVAPIGRVQTVRILI
jgi:cellobiose phosphorylase